MSRHTPRTRLYWKLREQVKREEPICWLCGEPFDYRLKWPEPMSFSVDHIKPAKTYPELREVRGNLHAAHLVCNQKRRLGKTRQPRPKPGLSLTVDDF